MLVADNLFIIEDGKITRPSEIGNPVEFKDALLLKFNNGVSYITSRDTAYMNAKGDFIPTDMMMRNFKCSPYYPFKDVFNTDDDNYKFKYKLKLEDITDKKEGKFDIADNDFAFLSGFMVSSTLRVSDAKYARTTNKATSKIREILNKFDKNCYVDVTEKTLHFKHSWLYDVIDALFDLNRPSIVDDILVTAKTSWLRQFFDGFMGEPTSEGKYIQSNTALDNLNFFSDFFILANRIGKQYTYTSDTVPSGFILRVLKKTAEQLPTIVTGEYIKSPMTLYDIGYREAVNVSGLMMKG